jgi:hypothetical protein
MASATVRISSRAHTILRELAAESGDSMQAILDRALEEYQRRSFLEAANADYAALQQDPEAWAEFQKELAVWDATLMDGLDPEEQWTSDAEAKPRTGENAATG